MSARDDGGPAFPVAWPNQTEENVIGPHGEVVPARTAVQIVGMTLRDYFAAKAMAAIVSKTELREISVDAEDSAYSSAAIGAYEYADAMLAARSA